MVEVRIRLKKGGIGAGELLRCAFEKAGIASGRIAEKEEKGRISLSVFPDSVKEARQIAVALRSLRLKTISYSIIPLHDSDWKTRWKKYFKPFNIARDIRIIPVWEKASSAPSSAEGIRLDTTSAFGTGLHATTRLMAGFIRENRRSLGSFLDVGTGSGILSLIAGRYGARDIWAIDYDREAVRTAEKNFRANKISCEYLRAVDFTGFRAGRRFDFVAANLLTEDLVRFRRKLDSLVAPGGILAVSGIFSENYPSFRRRFKSAGLRRVKAVRRGKWYAVLFRKRPAQVS